MSEEPGNGSSNPGPADEAEAGRRIRATRSFAPRPEREMPAPTPKSRYSRFVSAMKVVLPLSAVTLLVTVLFYSGVFDSRDQLDITFREIDSQPNDLRMVSPRIDGITGDGRPYVVTADTATQDQRRPNFVALENIQAEMKLDGDAGADNWLSLSAADGLLDSERQTLDLMERVDVFTTWGYEFHGTGATVDFEKGTLRSDEEVSGHGPLGTLRADRMSADHATQVLRFEGKVRMLIEPEGKGEGEE